MNAVYGVYAVCACLVLVTFIICVLIGLDNAAIRRDKRRK